MNVPNNDLRRTIVETIYRAKEGHIPSSFSIVDIIEYLYENILRYNPKDPHWDERDHFILSKGHGALGLFAVLEKHGFISKKDLSEYSSEKGILGGHPDRTKVPGVEASTGSLGHGFPFAVGTALGLRIAGKNNRVFTLVGDGECNEGTIWESALVASKLKLGNLVGIVDLNGSAEQVLPVKNLKQKWEAFGWKAYEMDGHSQREFESVFSGLAYDAVNPPTMIIAHTIKGKGVSFIEGHGTWHHKIPSESELAEILKELS